MKNYFIRIVLHLFCIIAFSNLMCFLNCLFSIVNINFFECFSIVFASSILGLGFELVEYYNEYSINFKQKITENIIFIITILLVTAFWWSIDIWNRTISISFTIILPFVVLNLFNYFLMKYLNR